MSGYMGMREALAWVVLNDCTEWLDDDDPSPSVTACLVADIYGINLDQITDRLRRTRAKIESEG
ncbi:hypothetical protein [Roseobacter litoralis]|uniref:hypothetical protein n=1 Tax=Roseobacter litoralis TaxID=42443 RepID=UPI0024956AF4|nr:hypothetical protein [Roseobacter litoralis]